MRNAFYQIGGVLYYLKGLDLIKAGSRQLSLLGGAETKVVNGVTYRLNKNRRWERADEQGVKPSSDALPVIIGSNSIQEEGSLNPSERIAQQVDAEAAEIVESKIQMYLSDPDLDNQIVDYENQRTFGEIAEEVGRDRAVEAMEEMLSRSVKTLLERKVRREAVEYEQQEVESSGDADLKQRYVAWKRLYPDVSYGYGGNLAETLEEWSFKNPDLAAQLAAAGEREAALDEQLSYQSLTQKGARLADAFIKKSGWEGANLSQREALMAKFLDKLKGTKKDKTEAKQLLNETQINDKGSGVHGPSYVDAYYAMIDVYAMTKGVPSKTLKTIDFQADRAFADDKNQKIDLGKYPSVTTAFHEVGHHIEFSDRRFMKAAQEFRESRASNSEPVHLGAGFRADEIALPGDYVNPYVGKVYPDGSTEVMSVGLEHFATPSTARHLLEADRGHFELILGVLDACSSIQADR